MSINVLTSEVLKRDVATQAHVLGVGGFAEGMAVEEERHYRVRRGGNDENGVVEPPIINLKSEEADRKNMVTGSLNLLVKYIPTEVITLYVATLSAAPALQDIFPNIRHGDIYWAFTIITPLLLFLVYVNKRATSGLHPIIPPAAGWPWWKLVAATIAFMIWALAVPGNPYVNGSTAAVVAGLGAVFISMILNLLEPIFERR